MNESDLVAPRSQIRAHVYDLSSVWQTINASLPSMQAYHVGVEVYGWEYTFQFVFDDPKGTGVVICKPTEASHYIFKESIDRGTTPLNSRECRSLLKRLATQWVSGEYHPIHKNCVDFSRALIAELKLDKELPAWVSSAADTSKQGGVLGWISERGWDSVKWYYGLDEPASPDPTRSNDVEKTQ